MRKSFTAASLTLLFSFISPDFGMAQNILQKEITLFERSAQGKVELCGFEYKFLFQDNLYSSSNALGMMSGSVAYYINNRGNLSTFFKINALHQKPFDQAYSISIKAGTKNLVGVRTNPCEGICMALSAQDTVEIWKSEIEGFDVRYNLQEKGLDFSFPISLIQASNYQTFFPKFSSCKRELMRQFENNIRK